MKTYIIYKAEYNGKVYIGYTNSDKGFERRKYEHILNALNGKQSKFYNALRKNHEEFTWEILVSGVGSQLGAQEIEKDYIREFDSFTFGYNSTLGGDGGRTWDNSGKNNPNYIHLEKEVINDIIESYNKGENLSSIAKRHELYINKVKSTLVENDIQLRPGLNRVNPPHKSDNPVRKPSKGGTNNKIVGELNGRFKNISENIELEVKQMYESGTLNKKQLMDKYGFGKRVLERIFIKYNIKKYYK